MSRFNRDDGTFASVSVTDLVGSVVTSIGGLVGSVGIGSGLSSTGGVLNTVASGDVIGPATNTNNNVPQWNGANSKTLKDGLTVGTGANNLVQLNGSSQLPAVDGSLLTGVVISQTSSTFTSGAYAILVFGGVGSVANNGSTSGANLNSPVFDSTGVITTGATQTGTWKNISGVAIPNSSAGYFARTA